MKKFGHLGVMFNTYLIDSLSIKFSSAAPSSLPRNKNGRTVVTGVPFGRCGQGLGHGLVQVGEGGKSHCGFTCSGIFTVAFSHRLS